MIIGIISAMDSEHRQLAARLQEKKTTQEGAFCYMEGRVGNNTLVLTQCGIGKVNAAIGTAELIRRYHPDCVISTGVAGGADERMKPADVVAAAQTVYHDVYCGPDGSAYGQIQGMPLYYESDESLLRHAQRIASQQQNDEREGKIWCGLIATGDRFVESAAELQQIRSHFPTTMAVDMESAAIAQTCYVEGKVPFISLRIVSDTPGAHPDNFAQYQNFWQMMADRSFETTWRFVSTLGES